MLHVPTITLEKCCLAYDLSYQYFKLPRVNVQNAVLHNIEFQTTKPFSVPNDTKKVWFYTATESQYNMGAGIDSLLQGP